MVSISSIVYALVVVSGRWHAILHLGHCAIDFGQTVRKIQYSPFPTVHSLTHTRIVAPIDGQIDRVLCVVRQQNEILIQFLIDTLIGTTFFSVSLLQYLQFYFLFSMNGRHAKAAVTIIVTFLLTSWIVSAMVSLKFNYSLKVSEPLESFGFLYEKPWTRLGPYVMGMATIWY